VTRVDQDVGRLAGLGEQLTLGGDALGQPAAALQRMRSPDVLEATDQHLVVGVDEHDARREAPLLERLHGPGQVGGERPAAHVEHHRGVPGRAAGLVCQLGHVQHQRLGQVVHDVVPDVLQGAGNRATTATRDAGDDHQVGIGARLLLVGHVAPSPTGDACGAGSSRRSPAGGQRSPAPATKS
jgi:hypothetical protein